MKKTFKAARSSPLRKMLHRCGALLLMTTLLLFLRVQASRILFQEENGVKSGVYLSPMFEMEPGEVANKYFHNIDFPRGHIGIKEFTAEVVDHMGKPVPLYDTYLHHWMTHRYLALIHDTGNQKNRVITLAIDGPCESSYRQYFGFGSETRKTNYYVPDPYALEVGKPAGIPEGYEERWYFNIHAIDTRGTTDKHGCTECRCNLYNVTKDVLGKPLADGYRGGRLCCYDKTQCRLKQGFQDIRRGLHLKYSIKWVDWNATVVPVRAYILDATDTGERRKLSETDLLKQDLEHTCTQEVGCKVEYDVEACDASSMSSNQCIHTKRATITMPKAGQIVSGYAHQHTGGAGAAIYKEDGRKICSSMPIYGKGNQVGDEAGYLVGMSNCIPDPMSARIYDGEKLVLESKYSNKQLHTGVMGAFYIYVADLPS